MSATPSTGHNRPSFRVWAYRALLACVAGMVLTHLLGLEPPVVLLAKIGTEAFTNVGHVMASIMA